MAARWSGARCVRPSPRVCGGTESAVNAGAVRPRWLPRGASGLAALRQLAARLDHAARLGQAGKLRGSCPHRGLAQECSQMRHLRLLPMLAVALAAVLTTAAGGAET